MIYSSLYFKDKQKVPTYAVFFIVMLAIFFLNRIFISSYIPSRASSTAGLRRVETVNLSSNQAAVFWQTEKKTVGWLAYGELENNLNLIALDERDLSEKKNSNFNHYAVLRNLKKDTVYYFKLMVDGKLVGSPSNKVFEFKTPSATAQATNSKPVYGRIVKKNGDPVDNGIVLLCLNSICPSAALTQTSGGWLITASNLSEQDKVKLEIYDEEGTVTNVAGYPKNLSPLPQTLTAGSSYEFYQDPQVLSATDTVDSTNKSKETDSEIIFPKENAVIPAKSPLFKGESYPESEVVLIINSKENFTTKIIADKDGVWKFSPPFELSAGLHSLTVIFKDKNNQEKRLTRKFTIAKSGEQVMGEATSSPTPTDIVPTATTAPTAAPTQAVLPTAETTPPVTGSSPNFIFIAATSVMVLGLGLLLAF